MNLPCECDNGSPCPVHTSADDWLCPECETAHAEDDECPTQPTTEEEGDQNP